MPRNFQFKHFRLDDPREWRPWDKLSQAERRPAFETLQKFKRAVERAKVLQAVGEADPNEFIDLGQFASQVKYSKVELVDPAGRGTSSSRSRRRSASKAGLQVQTKVKSEPADTPTMVPIEEAVQAPIETPIRASVETHIQPPIEEVIGVTAIASVVDDETKSNSQPQGKIKGEPAAVASVEHEKDKQSTPLRKKAKSENGLPRIPASLISQALPIDIDFAEEQILKLEEDARDLDKEIQEAEHLAELRRKKAAVKARLEVVNARGRRSTTSFSSPSGSIA